MSMWEFLAAATQFSVRVSTQYGKFKTLSGIDEYKTSLFNLYNPKCLFLLSVWVNKTCLEP